jgi:hypothetical protein
MYFYYYFIRDYLEFLVFVVIVDFYIIGIIGDICDEELFPIDE